MPDVLVVERFQGPARSRFFDPTPYEVIGVIKDWADRQYPELDAVVWQTAAQAKHYFTDKRLKDLGLYVKGMPHAMDALRHRLHFEKFSVVVR